MTSTELLEEAKKKYPVGTVFNSTGGNTNCLIKEDTTWSVEADRNILLNKPDGSVLGRLFNGSDRWAEIVKSPDPVIINEYQIF